MYKGLWSGYTIFVTLALTQSVKECIDCSASAFMCKEHQTPAPVHNLDVFYRIGRVWETTYWLNFLLTFHFLRTIVQHHCLYLLVNFYTNHINPPNLRISKYTYRKHIWKVSRSNIPFNYTNENMKAFTESSENIPDLPGETDNKMKLILF